MMQKIIDWILFKLNHQHDWDCHPDRDGADGGEKWYWHQHECRWCDKVISVLNAECETYKEARK